MIALQYPVGTGWVGVDFDRTLAEYVNWETNGRNLGKPIAPMVERVKRWIASGQPVKIFTARAATNSRNRAEDIALIRQWCSEHIGAALPVTAEKDFNCIAIWDDRSVAVVPNIGIALHEADEDPLSMEEEWMLAEGIEAAEGTEAGG